MNLEQWQEMLQRTSWPIVVEFWAPWCGPCRVMAPSLERVAHKFEGQVDLVRINADDAPEVVQALGILGIPTLIGFEGGREVFRRVGLQSESTLERLFEALLKGKTEGVSSLGRIERLMRLVSGTVILVLGWGNGPALALMLVGAALIFSAVYDRCPLYNALISRVKAWRRSQ
ncbi:thioredoxin domain-containing protein [uncultured Thermanaerothrix sp.]|uniref:thioredoxin domain-containing protein n=1 Tax=uncultured Thermanaerothrix sp. TaxID=1195149 RepID=UPI002613E0A6|nr:thioredoxin domain-containing protein [uncultured Thermanaerothrix sp.]